jgi:predicted transcriptional regulator
MKENEKSFGEKLFMLIDRSGMTDVECYKKANVDKKTFSKIKCNLKTYKPSKQTAVAFAIALRLDLEETQDLLASAGMTLSSSFTFDKIIRYFIQNENYDVFDINQALFEFDQVPLGTF